ncbi:diguanylate cyclase [Candidatus Uhrbacteria bacterium]|nr:MAG: diguanylate cyclase [Candidatus Uhrbacteria bacterium]
MSPHESEIPAVYKSEGRRLRPSLAKESVLKLRAETARARFVERKDRPEDDPERVQSSMDFEEANLDLETFDLTHDPTGALKRERVGADLAAQLAERMSAEAEPAPAVGAPEMITPVLLVNMGELDRLNKVSPDFGNEALTRLADVISRKVEEGLGEDAQGKPESFYKLYRADNNSFMIRFTEKIPAELAHSLQESLSAPAGERWGDGDDVFEKKGVEAPPVIADMVSVEETLAGLPPSLRTSGKAETYAVGALKDVLFTMQDARKIVSRVDRMRDAIAKDETKARDLYDKFLKKSLAGVFVMETGPEAIQTSVETFEQFKAYLASLDQDPAHANAQLWETAYGKVLGDLRLRYESDRQYAKKLQAFVAEKVQRERGLTVAERISSVPPGAELPADRPREGFEPPNRDEATEGLRAFARLRTEAGLARDNLEKARAQGAPNDEIARLEQAARIAEKKLDRERAKRDQATGLELRGPMFKRMESAMEDPSKRVAMVSIDMGFLKYFDQVGGRETGDLAILKAAELFQQVRDELSKDGIEMSVHRLGGDEFGMTVVGESSVPVEDFRKRLREIEARLQRKMQTSGRIPAQAGSKPGYYATNINLGVGTHFFENGTAAEAEDGKYGLTERPPEGIVTGLPEHAAWVRNTRAEHLVKVADKVMEFRKASNRLNAMLEKMHGIEVLKAGQASEEDLRREEEHLKQLLAFSDKAIFGKEGRAKLEAWRKRLQAGDMPEDMDAEVHDFVWEMMEKTFEQEQGERKDLENHVEYAVRIEYLKERINELQTRLDAAEGAEGRVKERHEHEQKRLQERLKAAEEDLEEVKALRTSLAA